MAGVLRVDIRPDVRGPLADGTADEVLRQWAENTAARLGDMGGDHLRAWPMDKSGRARGNFQRELQVFKAGPVARIPGPMDKGVVWAPWLEGVSKRNESTRFKGYRLFRKTAAWLRDQAKKVGEEELAKLIGRIGGV